MGFTIYINTNKGGVPYNYTHLGLNEVYITWNNNTTPSRGVIVVDDKFHITPSAPIYPDDIFVNWKSEANMQNGMIVPHQGITIKAGVRVVFGSG